MGKESVTKTRVRLLKAPPSVNLLVLKVQRGSQYILRGLFPFRKRSLPFFTVDATFGNQAFSHDGCNVFPGLSYNKANDTFLNSLRKNEVEAQIEFTLTVMEREGSAVIDVPVKKDRLLVYVLKFFVILAD